jgi:predicted DNA-binding transcriptional regulator YafY
VADGSAVKDVQAGEDWLIAEILSYRGEAAVIQPPDLRKKVATRAKELARELNVSRVAAAAR